MGMERPNWKETLALFVSLLLFSLLHFYRPNARQHFHSTHLFGPVTYFFNTDSAPFARLVIRFPHGFTEIEQGHTRIERPLYPALGWGVYQIVRPLSDLLLPQSLTEKAKSISATANHPEIWQDISGEELLSAWAALVLVNIGINGFSLVLFYLALLSLFARRVAFLLALLPAAHFNTVDFCLVPSSEPFNLMIPALLTYTVAVTWKAQRDGMGFAFALGLSFLGKKFLVPPVVWCYEFLATRPWRSGWKRLLLACLLLGGPTVLYTVILKVSGIPMRSYAMDAYRHFVWIGDYLREGLYLAIPVRVFKGFFLHYWHVALSFLGPCLVMLVLAFRSRRNELSVPKELRNQLAFYTIACGLFWALVGFVETRLAVVQAPAILFGLGILAVRKTAHPERWIGGAIAAQLLLYAFGFFAY